MKEVERLLEIYQGFCIKFERSLESENLGGERPDYAHDDGGPKVSGANTFTYWQYKIIVHTVFTKDRITTISRYSFDEAALEAIKKLDNRRESCK